MLGGASTPEKASTASGRRWPFIFQIMAVSYVSSYRFLFSASFRLGGLLDYVQPRFPGIGFGDWRTVGSELQDFVFAGIVTRPFWQSWAIRIACLGEVCPIGVYHPGNFLVFGRHCGSIPVSKAVKHVRDFRSVRCAKP